MKTNWLKNSLMLAAVGLVAGCGSMMQQNRTVHYSSSMYSYLNTNETGRVSSVAASPATVPLRIGIAFVPSQYSAAAIGDSRIPGETLSASDKMNLLRQIGDEFKKSPCVKSVELLPTTYLSPGGGFENLKHIGATFGLDGVVLIAYDQTQQSDEGFAAMSYWTIVGAYVVKGERNDTATLIEAALYDIASERLLLHASGTSTVKGSATPVNLSEELRADSKRGFEEATKNLSSGLRIQLEQFNQKVKR